MRKVTKGGLTKRVEILFHPLLVPLFAAVAWVRSLWAAKILLEGQWNKYNGFSSEVALSRFFYKIQWINIERYGRTGRSSLIGFGNYPLSKWFHISLLSHYIYANAPAMTTLCGTLFWAFSHLVWINDTAYQWPILVTLILLLSFTSFNMAFHRQNYNILGWMWLPVALYGLLTDNLAIATLSLFAGSFGSITMVFCTSFLVIMYSIFSMEIIYISIICPAIIKVCTHIFPMLNGKSLSGLIETAKLIGLSKYNVRYKRTSMKIGIHLIYIIFLYSIGSISIWLISDKIPILLFSALVLFIINQAYKRFADVQSVYMVSISVFAAYTMILPWSWDALIVFLLMANPFPFLLGARSLLKQRCLTLIPSKRPYDHTPVLQGLNEFLYQVPDGGRVFMSFSDPQGRYESVFNGQRALRDTVAYVANIRNIQILPDWYAVAESNYIGSPDFWGQDLNSVLVNLEKWNFDYTIIYQLTGTSLDAKWKKHFDVVSSYDWGEKETGLEGSKLHDSKLVPKWWLLKKKKFNNSATLFSC